MRVGDIAYIDTTLQYYGIVQPSNLDNLSDEEWARKFIILEDIRKKEAK